jgi:hypothetical protein
MCANVKNDAVNAETVIDHEMSDLAGLVDDLARRVANERPGAASAIAESLYDAAQRFDEIALKDLSGRGHA